mmetsp:Transcript_1721/g.5003  ORF Transcript_1721/g.5003 Transcript_1721/m.5003 type:complete len:235 (-) Transcript_1721:482-1186(-)
MTGAATWHHLACAAHHQVHFVDPVAFHEDVLLGHVKLDTSDGEQGVQELLATTSQQIRLLELIRVQMAQNAPPYSAGECGKDGLIGGLLRLEVHPQVILHAFPQLVGNTVLCAVVFQVAALGAVCAHVLIATDDDEREAPQNIGGQTQIVEHVHCCPHRFGHVACNKITVTDRGQGCDAPIQSIDVAFERGGVHQQRHVVADPRIAIQAVLARYVIKHASTPVHGEISEHKVSN